jgi:hypothetical protein
MLKVLDGDELDVSLLKKSLEERRKYCDFVFDTFAQNPLPISALASWLGIDYPEAHNVLSVKPEIGIRCRLDKTYLKDRDESTFQIAIGTRLLLDQSSVLTIERLNLWEQLRDFELLVMRSVVEQFDADVSKFRDDRSSGTMCLTETGQLTFQETSDSEKEEKLKELRAIARNIKCHCRIQESMASASVNSELRAAFGKVQAFPSLESIAFASENRQCVLWTDDAFVQWVAVNDFSLSTLGIQNVLKRLRDLGQLSFEACDELTARLLGMNYNPIVWNADVAWAAAKLSQWRLDSPPFSNILRQFKSHHWNLSQKSKMALMLFIKVYHSNPGAFKETQLLLEVMNSIGDSKAAEFIRSEAYAACMPHQLLYESIMISLDIWQAGRID